MRAVEDAVEVPVPAHLRSRLEALTRLANKPGYVNVSPMSLSVWFSDCHAYATDGYAIARVELPESAGYFRGGVQALALQRALALAAPPSEPSWGGFWGEESNPPPPATLTLRQDDESLVLVVEYHDGTGAVLRSLPLATPSTTAAGIAQFWDKVPDDATAVAPWFNPNVATKVLDVACAGGMAAAPTVQLVPTGDMQPVWVRHQEFGYVGAFMPVRVEVSS